MPDPSNTEAEGARVDLRALRLQAAALRDAANALGRAADAGEGAEQDGELVCGDFQPENDGPRYLCSLRLGHDGEHRAVRSDGTNYAVWPPSDPTPTEAGEGATVTITLTRDDAFLIREGIFATLGEPAPVDALDLLLDKLNAVLDPDHGGTR